jgi:hypothetical protein
MAEDKPIDVNRIYDAIEDGKREQRECHRETTRALSKVETELAATRAAIEPCRKRCESHDKDLNGNGRDGLKAEVAKLKTQVEEMPTGTSKRAIAATASGSVVGAGALMWIIQALIQVIAK